MNTEKLDKMEEQAAGENLFGSDIVKRFLKGAFVPVITALTIKVVAWACLSISFLKSHEYAATVNKYLQADWMNHIVGFLVIYGVIKGLVKMDSNWRGAIRLGRGLSHVLVCLIILMLVYPAFCAPYQEMIQGKNLKNTCGLWFDSVKNCEINSYVFIGAILGLIYGICRWLYNIGRTFVDGGKAAGDFSKALVKGRRNLGLQKS